MSDTSFGNSGAWLVATPWDHGAIELNNGVIIKRNQSGLQYGVFHNKSTDLLEMDHHGDYMMQCVRLYFEKQSVCHTSRMLPLKAVHLAEKKTPYSYDYSWWMCVCVCVCVCVRVCVRALRLLWEWKEMVSAVDVSLCATFQHYISSSGEITSI